MRGITKSHTTELSTSRFYPASWPTYIHRLTVTQTKDGYRNLASYTRANELLAQDPNEAAAWGDLTTALQDCQKEFEK